MKRWQKRTLWLALGTVILASRFLFAQAPLARICIDPRDGCSRRDPR